MAAFTGHTALVTGASSGIGADLARSLAGAGAALVLVARRAEALEQLAAEIRKAHGVAVRVEPADLLDETVRTSLAGRLSDSKVDILVNNAGLGLFGPFASTPWEKTRDMLTLDILALTHLTHLFLPGMLAAKWGRIMLLGSTGSFQPSPLYAAYAAAKAHVLSFGVALNYELKATGVSCTTLCPGVTRTGFFDVSGQKLTLFQRATIMQSSAVAQIGVDALIRQRASVVAGRGNALTALSTRLMPDTVAAAVAGRLMRN